MPLSIGLILASASAARAEMLGNAGISFSRIPAHVDEAAIRQSMSSGKNTERIACRLAQEKAERVSADYPESFVIGADQILDLDGTLLEKPGTRDGLEKQLRSLRGKTHTLISAASLAHQGVSVWSFSDSARLTMRPFSDAYLEEYMELAGQAVYSCVGGYQLEGVGAQLFDRIDGDYFTVLGLPLLALLGVLREKGILKT